MIFKVSVCIYLVVATFNYLANGLTKFSSSGYHIVHNDLPANHMFRFLQGNAPRYRSPPPPPILPQGIQGIAMFGQTSPAPGNPFAQFNPAYGAHFPTGGVAVCAIPPTQCQKSAYRTMDGSCNHLDNPQAGVANTRYGRLLSPKYGDGISSPTRAITGAELPNARLVSLVVFNELDVPDPEYTLVNMQWGQIMTHDMSMQAGGTQGRQHPTRCCTDDGRLITTGEAHSTCFPIVITPNDPAYSQVGTECLDFVRTLTDRDIKCFYDNGPAEQLTTVTSYADLSLVYGNSIQQNSEIRAFQGGRMLVDQRNGAEYLPPSRNGTGDCDAAPPGEVCYQAGDIRVNQNPGLAILHTILLREHNRIADSLAKLNPHYNDRTLFQEARKINIAQYQHISYYEWLPIFLGSENMLKNRLIYKTASNNFIKDFDSSIDPSVLNEHATAAFRYFHTQIEGRLDLVSELRSVLGSLRLSDWMNRPAIIEVGDNFDSLTRGHATQPEELTDINFDREIKHFLLRRNRPFGSDLRAIDIQRNRDHGLASYNDLREFCGLKRANSWEDYGDLIEREVIEKMKTLYASHEDVDLTVGGSVEAHVAGALAGPTFLCILTEQFYRTRVGDRFWHENGDPLTGFTEEQLAEIRKASMARLLCDNGNQITSMQPSAFKTISKSNPVVPCSDIPQVDLTKWIDQKPFVQPSDTLNVIPFHYGN
ncbi:peroxidase isoform X2 [Anastrepha ludens]|nr:peroxidase isoform X2 [Anastrepha ludens]XP_053970062.1 peroxidase isoform X2 [Anastrepha ludens]XP_053970063.1 peroxidase isoform X2 [Anastrepha ludens]